jgi:hypothetical protein
MLFDILLSGGISLLTGIFGTSNPVIGISIGIFSSDGGRVIRPNGVGKTGECKA